MAEHKQEVSEEDKMSQLQETFLGMLAGAPTPSRPTASAKKIKVNHPEHSNGRSLTTAAPDDSTQSGQVSQLCRMLAILTLRHEDALNALACQDQCILFLTQGAQGVTHLLIQAAQDWRG